MRDIRLNVLMTSAERTMLNELAERDGVTASDYVRLFIRKQHAETFGEQPAKPKRKTSARNRAR